MFGSAQRSMLLRFSAQHFTASAPSQTHSLGWCSSGPALEPLLCCLQPLTSALSSSSFVRVYTAAVGLHRGHDRSQSSIINTFDPLAPSGMAQVKSEKPQWSKAANTDLGRNYSLRHLIYSGEAPTFPLLF